MGNATKTLNRSNSINLRTVPRVFVKTSVFLFIIVVGILSSILLKILLIPFKENIFIAINTKYTIYPLSKILLFIIGVSIKINSTVPKQDTIFVSNHWGYLDSLTLMALSPCMVLSNTSIRNMFLIGKVMELMGFLFIDRINNNTIPDIIDKSTFLLNETQLNLVFFPEGGTNDGIHFRPFSTSFFQIGLNTHYDIQPLTINILEINGSKVNDKNIDLISMSIFGLQKGTVIYENPEKFGISKIIEEKRTILEPKIKYEVSKGLNQKEANKLRERYKKTIEKINKYPKTMNFFREQDRKSVV